MKSSTLIRNGVTLQMAELIGRLDHMISWPDKRSAMGDVMQPYLFLTVCLVLRKMCLDGPGVPQNWV